MGAHGMGRHGGSRSGARAARTLALLAALTWTSDRGAAQDPPRREPARDSGPARGDRAAAPRAPAREASKDAALQDAIKQLVREHVPDQIIEKAKDVARSLPADQKERLLAQARTTWARVTPLLGDDPARLTSLVRKCMELVPPERVSATLTLLDDALDRGGPGAAAAVAELVAKGKREILPIFLQLIDGHGGTVAEGAGRPDEEARAWRGLLAATTVTELLAGPGRETTRASMERLAQDVTLDLDGRQVTLDGWARATLGERFPYLLDGPLAGQAGGLLPAALAATDLRDLLAELPLVHTPFGAPLPPVQALADADPRDDDGVCKALEAIKTTVRLRDALKSGQDLAVSADDFVALAQGGQP